MEEIEEVKINRKTPEQLQTNEVNTSDTMTSVSPTNSSEPDLPLSDNSTSEVNTSDIVTSLPSQSPVDSESNTSFKKSTINDESYDEISSGGLSETEYDDDIDCSNIDKLDECTNDFENSQLDQFNQNLPTNEIQRNPTFLQELPIDDDLSVFEPIIETIVISSDDEDSLNSSPSPNITPRVTDPIKHELPIKREPPNVSWTLPMPKRLQQYRRKKACETHRRSLYQCEIQTQKTVLNSCLKRTSSGFKKVLFSPKVLVKNVKYKPTPKSKYNADPFNFRFSPTNCPRRRTNDKLFLKLNRKVTQIQNYKRILIEQFVQDEVSDIDPIDNQKQQHKVKIYPKDEIIPELKLIQKKISQPVKNDYIEAIKFNEDNLVQAFEESLHPELFNEYVEPLNQEISTSCENIIPQLFPIASAKDIDLPAALSRPLETQLDIHSLPDQSSYTLTDNYLDENYNSEYIPRTPMSVTDDTPFNVSTFNLADTQDPCPSTDMFTPNLIPSTIEESAPNNTPPARSSPQQFFDFDSRAIRFPTKSPTPTPPKKGIEEPTPDAYNPTETPDRSLPTPRTDQYHESSVPSPKTPDITPPKPNEKTPNNSITTPRRNEPLLKDSLVFKKAAVQGISTRIQSTSKASIAYSELLNPMEQNKPPSRSNKRTLSAEYIDEDEPDRINELLTIDFYNKNPWVSKKELQFHPSQFQEMIATMGKAATEIIDLFPEWWHFVFPANISDRKNYSITVNGVEFISTSVAYRIPMHFINANSTLDLCLICEKVLTHKFAVVNNCIRWNPNYTGSDIVKWQTEKLKACYCHWRSPSAVHAPEKNPWTLSRPKRRISRHPAPRNFIPRALGPAVLPEDFI